MGRAGAGRGALRPMRAVGGIRDPATARHVGVGKTPLAPPLAAPKRGPGLRFLQVLSPRNGCGVMGGGCGPVPCAPG